MQQGKELSEAILSSPIGVHSARVERVLGNLLAHFQSDAFDPQDDRLAHIMSRVGAFSRPLAEDLRNGAVSVEDAATLLEQLAQIGDLAFHNWLNR